MDTSAADTALDQLHKSLDAAEELLGKDAHAIGEAAERVDTALGLKRANAGLDEAADAAAAGAGEWPTAPAAGSATD